MTARVRPVSGKRSMERVTGRDVVASDAFILSSTIARGELFGRGRNFQKCLEFFVRMQGEKPKLDSRVW